MVIYENTELALALWYKGRLLCSTTSYIREFLLDVHLLLGSLDIELCACVWAWWGSSQGLCWLWQYVNESASTRNWLRAKLWIWVFVQHFRQRDDSQSCTIQLFSKFPWWAKYKMHSEFNRVISRISNDALREVDVKPHQACAILIIKYLTRPSVRIRSNSERYEWHELYYNFHEFIRERMCDV